MNQKGFAPILIVIIITVLVGGYLIYQNSQNQSKTFPLPTPQLTSTPTSTPISTSESTNSAETVNWKTYTNTKYGFEIKLPIETAIDDIPSPTKPLIWIWPPKQSGQDAGSQLGIDIVDNPKSKSVKDFCLTRWNSSYPIIEERQIKIGDIIAYTVRLNTKVGPNVSTTCIAKENKIIVLEFDIDSIQNDPFVKEHTQTLNLIISTFKFLK